MFVFINLLAVTLQEQIVFRDYKKSHLSFYVAKFFGTADIKRIKRKYDTYDGYVSARFIASLLLRGEDEGRPIRQRRLFYVDFITNNFGHNLKRVI